MKISPIAQGTGTPGMDVGAVSTQRSSPDRIAAAKEIAAGGEPRRLRTGPSDTPQDPQVERMNRMKTLKMQTNFSQNREPAVTPPVDNGGIDTSSNAPVAEAQKPLSPQFAALAKQKRALQIERANLDREKAALASSGQVGGDQVLAELKSNPLGVLRKAGVSYDQLTEAVLNDGSGSNPEIQALKAEVQALKEGVNKTFVDRDTQAEQQVLSQIKSEAIELLKQGDAFETVRATKSLPKVMDLIYRTYKKTGEVLDTDAALQLVEDQLIDDYTPIAQLTKIQQRLTPQAPAQGQPQNQQRQMRTLTNRDTAQPPLSRRDRMLAAFKGELKR